MPTSTFKMDNETDATALCTYFGNCGFPANRKGVVVKVKGDTKTLTYLFNKFITITLI